MTQSAHDPKAVYTQRLQDRQASASLHRSRDQLLANVRLAVFAGALVIASAAYLTLVVSWWWLCLPLALFCLLVILHERTLRALVKCEGAVGFYEMGLARLNDEWAGKGSKGDDWNPEDHAYAADLDLFGEGSLFELLCTARTRIGEATLARWLCEPASAHDIASRQRGVDDLNRRLDLRETMALVAGEVRAKLHPDALMDWASKPLTLQGGPSRRIAQGVTAAAVLSILGWAFWGFGPLPIAGVAFIEIGLMRWFKTRVSEVVGNLSEPVKDLELLASILSRIEAEHFESEALQQIQEGLSARGGTSSEAIARLHRLLLWLDAQRNQLFAPLAFVLLWPVHFAFAIEGWRAEHGGQVREWMQAVGDFEALSSLAAYAFEHPADPFPELCEDGCVYEGEDLGHPLLPEADCVRNDVALNESPRLLIVSGSNMSGKSTLLRTVGVNAVLALAGGPVRAKRLRLSPLSLGATLAIHDSLQSGTSRFYAEIQRIQRLMDMAGGERPLLFLMDEILHGTNSHDRGIGAVAVLRGLVERGALGLVTTHDLALTECLEVFEGRAQNVHFEDHLEGDRLVFDYRLRPGVVTKSNALALMRAIGLDV